MYGCEGGVLQEMCYLLLENEHLQESVSVVCSSARFTSLTDHLFFDLIPPPPPTLVSKINKHKNM